MIKRGVILICVVVLGLIGVLSYAPVAHAGSNGQQVWFTSNFNSLATGNNRACPSGPLQVVYIEGTNQNGKPTVWVDWHVMSGWGAVYTRGYWWVGNIRVTYEVGSRWYAIEAFVPGPQWRGQANNDYAYVDCLGSREQIWSNFHYDTGSTAACPFPWEDTRVFVYSTGYIFHGRDKIVSSGYSMYSGGAIVPRMQVITQAQSPECVGEAVFGDGGN